ncbi:MerR family transcriptional regulator [Viridibacillus sp. YIM B01967]|uniref:MerR family transcriptional regulator n=1 Tax=Viridibacillus soli TaxID=2798301 RepID=A0ABS1H9M7_9BACL|nr:MerR family transcriptional regulator [Viridibacillus soli]MBK3496119.1 MerR family transcriptional regulator [Viridibacillus soli]
MEITIQKLAKLSGVSTRTLRYYDDIGLLKPARVNSSSYRIYGQAEVDLLQQILFYRELGFKLEVIKEMVTAEDFDYKRALAEHHEALMMKRQQLDVMITTVNKTIDAMNGGVQMSNKEKFEGFKNNMIADNEQQYGQEIRLNYGDGTVDASNKKVQQMTELQYEEVQALEQEVKDLLKLAMADGQADSEIAQRAADTHKRWLMYYWPQYSKEAHAGLAEMYVADERFTSYYDIEQPGIAKLLRDAILIYTGKSN